MAQKKRKTISRTLFAACLVLSLMLAFSKCAPGLADQGLAHFQANEYEEAITDYQRALEGSDDPLIMRDMGIVYYKMARMEDAAAMFRQALMHVPEDGFSMLYLGMTLETLRDYEGAIEAYSGYQNVSFLENVRRQVEARLYTLIRKQIEADVNRVIAGEGAENESAAPAENEKPRIAVFALRNLGSEYFDPLSKGLAEMLITDLAQVRALEVVERLRINSLINEMNLGRTGLMDSAVVRAGRLLGTRYLVSGSFMELNRETLRIDAAVTGMDGAQPGALQSVEGHLSRVFTLEKELVFSIIEKLGLTLSLQERDAIQTIPTENLLAFMAYSRGLDYEDKGEWNLALGAFARAVDLDSTFVPAQEKFSTLETLTGFTSDLQELDASVQLAREGQNRGRFRSTLSVQDHLLHMGELMHTGLMPGPGRRNPVTEGQNSPFGNSAVFDITVPLKARGVVRKEGSK